MHSEAKSWNPNHITLRKLLRESRALRRSFFERPTVEVARELLGKIVLHKTALQPVAGRIVETEAYLGKDDLAAHSARGLTPSTRVIFGPPGHAYVYLCYGMYECLNLIAEADGAAGCVLIRALEPVLGLEEIARRRPAAKKPREWASGPGRLTMAMGISRRDNGTDVTRGALTVRAPRRAEPFEIVTTTRIGISNSTDLPLRFHIKDNEYVSGPRSIGGRRGS